MAQRLETVEVFVLMDGDGCTALGSTAGEARDRYEEDTGALNETAGFRMIHLKVVVPLPDVAVLELEAEAPALGEPGAEVA